MFVKKHFSFFLKKSINYSFYFINEKHKAPRVSLLPVETTLQVISVVGRETSVDVTCERSRGCFLGIRILSLGTIGIFSPIIHCLVRCRFCECWLISGLSLLLGRGLHSICQITSFLMDLEQ